MNKNYTIEVKTAKVPVSEYVRECIDVEMFLAFCKACPNYNKRWCCPDFDFNPMDIWNKYDELELVCWVIYPDKSMTMAEAAEVLDFEKNRMQAELLSKEDENSYALPAGSCTKCAVCEKEKGGKCIHPEWMRHSIEALGGDVIKTAEKYLGMKILWSTDGSVPEYLMPVGGMLTRKGGNE